MNEDFLYYLWQYQLFFKSAIKTTNQQEISILKTGIHNKNSGPDFLNAQIKIDAETWFGNVEMHVKSSDWYVHNHEVDSNYDAVILHVVWEHDVTVFTKENQVLPTLELKNFVDKELIFRYNNFIYDSKRWIPCENQLETVETFLITNWLERLYFERLENKSLVIKDILQQTNFDFEAVLFVLLVKNFGLKVNGDAFLKLVTSMDFSVVKKIRFDEQQLAALFFGQAGFLEDDFQEQYHISLKKDYDYLRHKYHLEPIHKNHFHFFRMRPPNFPTIRIAQLVSLYHQHQNLFSKVMELEKKEDFYLLFSVNVQEFWKTHFTFETESKKSSKKITKSFVDLLLINTIIPLKFVYLQEKSGFDEEAILKLISQITPEKNSIIEAFSKLKVSPKNALESQALLTLKNDYCTKKRCLHCAIGNRLLRS